MRGERDSLAFTGSVELEGALYADSLALPGVAADGVTFDWSWLDDW